MPLKTSLADILKRTFSNTLNDLIACLRLSSFIAIGMFYFLSLTKAYKDVSTEFLLVIGLIGTVVISILSLFIFLPKLRKKIHN